MYKIILFILLFVVSRQTGAQSYENIIIISDMDNTYKKTHGFIGISDLWNIFITKKTYEGMPELYNDFQKKGAEIYILTNQTKLSKNHVYKHFRKDNFKPDTIIIRKSHTKGFEHKTEKLNEIIIKNPTKK